MMEQVREQLRHTTQCDKTVSAAEFPTAGSPTETTKNDTVSHHEDGTIELLTDKYPNPGTQMRIDMAQPYGSTNAEIVGVFTFDGGKARFPIGLASFSKDHAKLRFFGKPVKGCRVLIHEGLQRIDLSNDAQH